MSGERHHSSGEQTRVRTRARFERAAEGRLNLVVCLPRVAVCVGYPCRLSVGDARARAFSRFVSAAGAAATAASAGASPANLGQMRCDVPRRCDAGLVRGVMGGAPAPMAHKLR